jgi:hypothetical protein
MDRAKAERAKALEKEGIVKDPPNLFAPHSPISQNLQQQQQQQQFDDSQNLMSLDLGVERLYPAQSSTGQMPTNVVPQQPNALWQQQSVNFTMGPSADPILMGNTMDSSNIIGNVSNRNSIGLLSPEMPGLAAGGASSGSSWSPVDPFNNNNGTTHDSSMMIDDGNMNWATWDDMVNMYAMQNELHQDGQNTIPAFFSTGANLF